MKNKREEQIQAKQQHKNQLKANRRREQILERPEPYLIEYQTFLIVCEGKNTEPSYFNQFKLITATVYPVGEGYNTISLVRRAIQLQKEREYDQVWCVFDKDAFKVNDFNNAIRMAKKNNFGLAYSNQAFEYWLILHFDDHQGAGMHRDDYNDKINKLLQPFGVSYDGEGSKNIEEDFFALLDGIDDFTGKKRADLAIKRAERNYNNLDHVNPAREESSTTVFQLVKELLKYR